MTNLLCRLSGFMVWWLNAGRRDQHVDRGSRTSTPACEPGRGCRPTPAPARPLVAEATPPPRPPRSAPALWATSATRATPLPPQLPGTSTQPRLCPPQVRWLPSQPGHPWLCPKPTSASSPSTDTPSRQGTRLFRPTSLPPFLPPGSSSTTCPLLKAAHPAAPAAPPARVTSAECPPPRAPTMTPTHHCSPTASCRGAGRVRCMDKRGWDRWTTHRKHQRCSLTILTYWCITTRSSPQTCKRIERSHFFFVLGTQNWEF